MSVMNRYGRAARDHWTRVDPDRVSTMDDPEMFFRDLGEQVESRVQELTDYLTGPDGPSKTYLETVGRLNIARLQAEEGAIAELGWLSEPAGSPEQNPTKPGQRWTSSCGQFTTQTRTTNRRSTRRRRDSQPERTLPAASRRESVGSR